MSRPVTIADEARWVARSPIPVGNTTEQLMVLNALLTHLDTVCRLAWRLNASRFALTLEADRLAARQMRARLAIRSETPR